jgi:hypothetical protein
LGEDSDELNKANIFCTITLRSSSYHNITISVLFALHKNDQKIELKFELIDYDEIDDWDDSDY